MFGSGETSRSFRLAVDARLEEDLPNVWFWRDKMTFLSGG